VADEDGDDEEQAKLECPFYLDGVGYFDEHHREVRFGHGSSGTKARKSSCSW
jgi:hypothetical protein